MVLVVRGMQVMQTPLRAAACCLLGEPPLLQPPAHGSREGGPKAGGACRLVGRGLARCLQRSGSITLSPHATRFSTGMTQ